MTTTKLYSADIAAVAVAPALSSHKDLFFIYYLDYKIALFIVFFFQFGEVHE